MQLTCVRLLQSLNVLRSLAAANHQRKPTRFDGYDCGERTRNTAIAILKRMNLSETMVQPRGFNFWRHVPMRVVHLNQAIHLRRGMFRRTEQMDFAIRSRWVVGMYLPVAANQWNFNPLPRQILGLNGMLLPCKNGVKLFDERRGQFAILFYKCENTLQCLPLRRNNIDDSLRWQVCRAVGNQARLDSVLNQRFTNAAVDSIDVLDNSCLYCPLTIQALVELIDGFLIARLGALGLPQSRQALQLAIRQVAPIVGEVFYRLPGNVQSHVFIPSGAIGIDRRRWPVASQPYLEPVRSRSSLSMLSRLLSGSALAERRLPFTVRF